jgi:ATP-dependent RNA helicase RhlE
MDEAPSLAESSMIGQNFADFGLDARLLRAVAEQGYTQATPIQTQAIPVVLQGRDVMGIAQTGTGKTAAFVLPVIQRLLPLASDSVSPARHPVRALILVPTRELVAQVADNVSNYACHTPLRATFVFGGMDMAGQIARLRSGVEILIATPGRLLDHLQQKTVSLAQVQLLVLDEADRMLDMGFLPDLQRIVDYLPLTRQTLLFSATFSTAIKKLAQSYLRDPVTIEVLGKNASADSVQQLIYAVAEEHKIAAILHILARRASPQCIIFCNSKLSCAHVGRTLMAAGILAGALHGDKSQSERMHLLEAFKNGEVDSLVATDVAARGLDISAMPCVINFDLPYTAQDYVHRIGRTGRAGAVGDAISLYTEADQKYLSEIEKLIGRSLTPAALEGFSPPNLRQSARYKDLAHDNSSSQTIGTKKHNELPDPIFTQPYLADKTPPPLQHELKLERPRQARAALLRKP